MRAALLLGASGLVGSHCLDRLLAEPAYGAVRALVRRPTGRAHAKLDEVSVDFDRLEERPKLFQADDVFCCLGTTMRRAGSEAAFRRVDHDYPLTAARLSRAAGAERFLVVSALGADPGSRIFYNRVKGEMESAVQTLAFRAVWILRPSLLLGERGERRTGERIAALLARPLSPLLAGPLRRYRPIEADAVAAAMVRLALNEGTGGVVESEVIARLAGGVEG